MSAAAMVPLADALQASKAGFAFGFVVGAVVLFLAAHAWRWWQERR